MAWNFCENYFERVQGRRVNYIYKLVFGKQTKFPEDLEEAKERTRERIDQEIDSMMLGVRCWRKQDASIVRERVHKKRLKFWEDAERQRKVKYATKEVKDELEEHIEKMRNDFEDHIQKMWNDFEVHIQKTRKDFEEEVFKLRTDFGIKRIFHRQFSKTTMN